MTLQSLLDQYFRIRLLADTSIQSYRDSIRSFEQHFTRDIDCPAPVGLHDVTEETLLAWRAKILEKGSSYSWNSRRRHMKALLTFAVAEGLIPKSPMLRVTGAATGRKLPKVVRSDWYKQALVLLGQDKVFLPTCLYRAMLGIFYYAMIRRRQLKCLTWGDVLWSQRAIRCASSGSKTKMEHVLPLPKQVMETLRELRQATSVLLGRQPAATAQVFDIALHKTGVSKATTVGMISHVFTMLSKRLGFKISTHRVRHTSATSLLMATGNLKITSLMLGHSTISQTADIYVHPSLQDLRKAQKKLKPFDLA